jgi:hypothetical protein
VLTEAQVIALEKAKTEKEAHGEFASEHPGYCGAQDTFYVGNLKGVGRVYQQTFIDTYAKVAFAKLVNAGAKLRQPAGVKLHYLGRIVGVGFAAWLADLLGRASGQAPGPRSGALQARGLTARARTELSSVMPRCASCITQTNWRFGRQGEAVPSTGVSGRERLERRLLWASR